jgi:DNA-binding protein H-NS
MTQTYAQMIEHIAKLQAEAEAFRREEVAAVVAKIKEDIKAHGLTPQDLFGKSVGAATKGKSKTPSVVKYADGAGNTWAGRGKRPKWLNDALTAGKKVEDFLFGASTAKVEPKAAQNMAVAKKTPANKVRTKK